MSASRMVQDAGLIRPRPARAARRAYGHRLFSPGVFAVACMLSALHLLNFLNYTRLANYFDPPAARSALLVIFALAVLMRHTRNLAFHLRQAWDVYAICLLALVSAAYSLDPSRTLKYSLWLLLSVYVGTELAARIRKPNDMVLALGIVFIPISVLVAVVNVTLGPVVVGTGRQFGALGSAHVDTALAMDFICLFLALRAIPAKTWSPPKWLRLLMLAVLSWAVYQAIFGLTRSVWLGVAMALGLYVFRNSLSLRSLAITLVFGAVAVSVLDYVGLERVLPQAVQGRLEVTEQRIESGQVDPRLEGIRYAWAMAIAEPQGTGYATASSHNSYMNILLNLGWLGFALALLAIGRSLLLVAGKGLHWLLFFAIGSAPLFLHAFFEVQTWPGQANFIPLLVWYAMSRSRFDVAPEQGPAGRLPRYRFVDA